MIDEILFVWWRWKRRRRAKKRQKKEFQQYISYCEKDAELTQHLYETIISNYGNKYPPAG